LSGRRHLKLSREVMDYFPILPAADRHK